MRTFSILSKHEYSNTDEANICRRKLTFFPCFFPLPTFFFTLQIIIWFSPLGCLANLVFVHQIKLKIMRK